MLIFVSFVIKLVLLGEKINLQRKNCRKVKTYGYFFANMEKSDDQTSKKETSKNLIDLTD